MAAGGNDKAAARSLRRDRVPAFSNATLADAGRVSESCAEKGRQGQHARRR
ncbi:hypothetical protein ENKO_43610 (plasmid) [Enterobacter kobei]|uniref:Uncharacterized protein n=1 Tax=Enterobacter kobei TaxID=208224 RepID=A0AA86J3A2_9ENTR|nr:hypothetical protein ENKO_43610 [Enterobacter kobei]